MSRLKLSENLFLEVAELNRLQKFINEDGYKLALKSIIKKFGIVSNQGNTFFKVSKKNNNTIIIEPGLAFDTKFNAIKMEESLEMEVRDTGMKRWLVLSYSTKSTEQGTVSISEDGTLLGINTKFLEVLRGQPNFPTKVRFNSNLNKGEYEVVSVNSNNDAIIAGAIVPEDNVKYSVIGTFTPGFQPEEENREIYEYDSYKIEAIDSEAMPNISDDEFILASIQFDALSEMSVTDERGDFIFNSRVNTNTQNKNGENRLVSLLQSSLISSSDSSKTRAADIELILEHGYSVSSYDWNVTPERNIFRITRGSSNFLKEIPDGFFNGWILLNRKNMEYVMIEKNEGANLYISTSDSNITKEVESDFVIVPNFSEIEYEVTVDSNVYRPSCPFYFKESIVNIFSRLRFYLQLPAVEGKDSVYIKIRYRLIDKDSDEIYPFRNIAVAQFTNIRGTKELLGDSKFRINLRDIEPEEKKRNYS